MADYNNNGGKKYDNDFTTKEFFSINHFGENKADNKRFSASIANRFSIWFAIKGTDAEGKFKKNECTFFGRIEDLANILQMVEHCISEAKEGTSFDTCVINKNKEFGIVGRKLVKGDMNIGFYMKDKEAGSSAIVYAPIADAFYINNESDKTPLPASKGLAVLEDFRLKIIAIIDRSSTVYAAHLREVADKYNNSGNSYGAQDRGYKNDNNESSTGASADDDAYPFD